MGGRSKKKKNKIKPGADPAGTEQTEQTEDLRDVSPCSVDLLNDVPEPELIPDGLPPESSGSDEPEADVPDEKAQENEGSPEDGEAPEDEEAPEDASDDDVSQISDELAYKVLGPQSVIAQLFQLVVGAVPFIGAPLIALWVFFGGTAKSVAFVSVPTALALAIMAFWACGGCANVNRRRFARAYFLMLIVVAALLALAALLAVSFGFRFSPVLKRLLTPYL